MNIFVINTKLEQIKFYYQNQQLLHLKKLSDFVGGKQWSKDPTYGYVIVTKQIEKSMSFLITLDVLAWPDSGGFSCTDVVFSCANLAGVGRHYDATSSVGAYLSVLRCDTDAERRVVEDVLRPGLSHYQHLDYKGPQSLIRLEGTSDSCSSVLL